MKRALQNTPILKNGKLLVSISLQFLALYLLAQVIFYSLKSLGIEWGQIDTFFDSDLQSIVQIADIPLQFPLVHLMYQMRPGERSSNDLAIEIFAIGAVMD